MIERKVGQHHSGDIFGMKRSVGLGADNFDQNSSTTKPKHNERINCFVRKPAVLYTPIYAENSPKGLSNRNGSKLWYRRTSPSKGK